MTTLDYRIPGQATASPSTPPPAEPPRSVDEVLAQSQVESVLAELDRDLLDGGCLLCSEHDPSECHRHVAADMLADRWPEMRVQHLTLKPPRLHLV